MLDLSFPKLLHLVTFRDSEAASVRSTVLATMNDAGTASKKAPCQRRLDDGDGNRDLKCGTRVGRVNGKVNSRIVGVQSRPPNTCNRPCLLRISSPGNHPPYSGLRTERTVGGIDNNTTFRRSKPEASLSSTLSHVAVQTLLERRCARSSFAGETQYGLTPKTTSMDGRNSRKTTFPRAPCTMFTAHLSTRAYCRPASLRILNIGFVGSRPLNATYGVYISDALFPSPPHGLPLLLLKS